jgi:tetratricopeptide (TPR) repeat protein
MLPLVLLISVGLMFGCGKKKSESELISEIAQLEAKEDFAGAAKTLEVFIKDYPRSEKTPEMMNKLAMIYASSEKDFQKAIALHQQIIKKFPDTKYAIQSQFMIGYIYANEIKDYDKAREKYEAFLKKYPDHELATSVKWELENLGKPLSEIDIFANSDKQDKGDGQ